MKPVCVVLLLILVSVTDKIGAEPVITNINSGSVVGSGFGTNPVYTNWSNMDDWSSEITYDSGQSDVFTGVDGNVNWLSDVDAADAAACLSCGIHPFQVTKDASNYSSGYGFRHGVAYRNYTSSVMNFAFKFDIQQPSTDGLYYRFYVKNDEITPPGTYAPNEHKLGFLWYNHNSGGSGDRTFVPTTSDGTLGGDFTVINQSTGAVWSYAPYDEPKLACFPGTNKWYEVTCYNKLNTFINGVNQGGAEFKMWVNGVEVFDLANHIPLAANRSLANELNAVMDRIEFGGNVSGGTQSWLSPGEGGYRNFDDFAVSTETKPKSIPCVYLSNSSTWGIGVTDRWNGDGTFVRQVVGGTTTIGLNSWKDNGFEYERNNTGLNEQEPIYMYVINWDGQVNSSGYLVSTTIPTNNVNIIGVSRGSVVR